MKLFFIEIYMAENSSFSISQWLKNLLELFNVFNQESHLNECDNEYEQTYPIFFAGSFWY
jgi:hypothetical protein